MTLLRERLGRFHDLVDENNRMLELIAEAGDMLGGEYIFDIQYLHKLARDARDSCHSIIDNLNTVTGGRYPELLATLDHISAEIDAILKGRTIVAPSDYVILLEQLDETMLDAAGAKMARLGGVRRWLKVDVPDGFVVSTHACQVFLQENGIADEAEIAFTSPGPYDIHVLQQRSQRLRRLVLGARLPRAIARAINRGVRTLLRSSGCTGLAVRSSALGEDCEHSYAGQFATLLGVARNRVHDAYREVIASMFSTDVMVYRQNRGLHPTSGLMAVGCQCMVPARAGGVMYTIDPLNPHRKSLQISAALGLGKSVVEGSVTADQFIVSRTSPHEIEERRIAAKTQKQVVSSAGAVEQLPVAEQSAMSPAVSDDQLRQLAAIGLSIERSMKCVVDIEWAISATGELNILQVRPLRIIEAANRVQDLTGITDRYPTLLSGQGAVACGGVASGPVVVVEDVSSLDVADGSVLVARTSTPRLAAVVPHANAVITDVGNTTSHLATIAREYRVPTIVDAGNATQALAGVAVATVDADFNAVYEGRVDELLHRHLLRESSFEDTNEFRMLRRILRRVAPLNLRDPQSREFSAAGCSTYHDIIRFAHEKAVQELAEGDWLEASTTARSVYRLDLSVPLDLVLVDLGGGLTAESLGRKRVDTESITSIPLQALITGLTTDGVWETNPTAMDPSAFMASATSGEWLRTISSPPLHNLAIISGQYLNLNLRLGFHFNIVDCFIGATRNDNYIYFRFAGGVTELRRRARRATLLGRILESHDFVAETKGDLVTARIKKISQEAMLQRMRVIGQLIGYARQLDIVLSAEETVDDYVKRFLDGRFGSAEAPVNEQHDRRTA